MPALPEAILPNGMASNDDVPKEAPTREMLCMQIRSHAEALIAAAESSQHDTFKAFETALRPLIFTMARLVITLFLWVREQKTREALGSVVEVGGQSYVVRPAQPRKLNTMFGVVRYWRTYLRAGAENRDRRGFHPLDVQLGLTADRLSMNLSSVIARLATKLSYAQTHATLWWFMQDVPSTEVIEKTVLGLGSRTAAWFEQATAPQDDGEVLVIQFDSKGVPTATHRELERRRGKRRTSPQPKSKRHRGRRKRQRYGSKPRRKKGDKSKNAKMATMVVMYTLKRSGNKLLGPINRWVYASFAPKRHAFEIAVREAAKRGFGPTSGKLVQIVTDGDDDLEVYRKEYFPDALRTVDIYHVIEYLWTAGACIFREGSDAQKRWVTSQKSRLYSGHIQAILRELQHRLDQVPQTGPGTKGKRERLAQIIGYIETRQNMMNYGELRRQDLEIGSGAIEGAIKYVIGRRFDHGGMRWIPERAEALLQLRCIDINGDWDSFIDWVHNSVRRGMSTSRCMVVIQREKPAPLPEIEKAA